MRALEKPSPRRVKVFAIGHSEGGRENVVDQLVAEIDHRGVRE